MYPKVTSSLRAFIPCFCKTICNPSSHRSPLALMAIYGQLQIFFPERGSGMEISWQPRQKQTRLVMFTTHQRKTCRFGDPCTFSWRALASDMYQHGRFITTAVRRRDGGEMETPPPHSDSRPPSAETSKRNECFKIKAHGKDLCLV